ncbi:unnamed protein product, partial [Notodromas monacha]
MALFQQSDGPRLKPLAIASGGGGAPSLITEDNIKNIHGKGIHLGDMAAVDDFFESLAGHGGGWSGHKRNANSAGSLLEGAQGGKPCGQVAAFAEQFSIPLSEGGFGGGGGGCFGGGGGGGYYGGDGGEDVSSNGEGGWSFASGTDVAIQEGANEGPGEVVILPAMSGKRCGCEYQCLPLSADMVSIRCLCPSHLFLGPDGFSCIADVTVGQAVDLSVIIPLAVIAVIMFGVFIALSFSICTSLEYFPVIIRVVHVHVCLFLFTLLRPIIIAGNQYQKRRHRIMGLTNRPLSSMALNRMGAQFGDGTGATLLGAPTALPGGAVMDSNMVTEYNPNYEFGGICSLQDLKTVPRDRLSLVKGLGQGAFGEVYQGYLRNDENAEMAVAVKDPDVINTALPICTGVMALEMDTTIIRPPPSTDGSLPCLSLARGIGRAHSLSSSGAQSSHRSGGSGSSMTIGTRSMRQANRSEYMVPRNASSGALASRAEQERAVFGDGEMSRQQSVPYNMHETASTERLLAEA